jgi:hypothetical protein
MDKRITYYLVVDVESCPVDKNFVGVDPANMFVYDVGLAMVDRNGTVYATGSYVISDIFFKEKELMQSAYYAHKIPQYIEDIRNGSKVVKSFYEVRQIIADLMAEYNCDKVLAYNARFDDISLKTTQRWLTKSKYRYFLPYGTIVWDILKMIRDTLGKSIMYHEFCEREGYVTANGRPQLKAEVVYKYLSGNYDFVESHTGLEDVLIEKDIFAYCMRQHKAMRKELYASA